MLQFARRYHRSCIVIVLVVVSVLLGCLTFNYFVHGVLALPFIHKPIATFKTTSHEDTEKCYIIYSNGNLTEAANCELNRYSGQSNQFSFVPGPDSTELNDMSKKVHEQHLTKLSYFRDNNNIFVVGTRDCGFGTSIRKIYAYNITSQQLNYLGQLPTNADISWIYTK